MDPIITASLIQGGLQGLGSFLQGQGEESAAKRQEGLTRLQLEHDVRTREGARKELRGYGYTPYGRTYTPYSPGSYKFSSYVSPYQGMRDSVITQYLKGTLDPAQQALLDQERSKSMTDINTIAASSGMPTGGRLSLVQRLGENIALKAAGLADQNRQFGIQALLPYEQMGLQQFLTNQNLGYNQFTRNQDITREEGQKTYEYGLADYIREQQAKLQGQELLARYAYV